MTLTIVTGLSVTITITLGIIILYKSRNYLLFALFCFVIGIWMIVNYISFQVSDVAASLMVIRSLMVLAVVHTTLLFLFINTFPTGGINIRAKSFWAITIATVLSIANALSPLLYSRVEFIDDQVVAIAGYGMIIFLLHPVGTLLLSLGMLIYKLSLARGIRRLQLKYITAGLLITYALILILEFVITNVLHISYFVQFASLFFLPFVIATYYAITRYRFLNIRVILRRALIVNILVLLCTMVTAVILFITNQFIASYFLVIKEYSPFIVMIALLLIFPGLRRLSYCVTDHCFFSNYIDLSVKMEELTAAKSSGKPIDQVFREVVEFMKNNLNAQHVIIFIYDATTKDKLVQVWPSGKSEYIYLNDPIVNLTQQCNNVVVLDELILSLKTELVRRSIAQLKHLNAQLAVSFGNEDRVFGLFFVGPKSAGIYTKEELDVMLRLSKFLKQIVPQVV